MRKFGLIGGLSWHSTVGYYTTLNQRVNERYGDNTNPPLRLVSLNQKQVHDLQRADDWGAIADILIGAARELQALGVEGMALCANTPHKVFEPLSRAVACPIIHIADAIGAPLAQAGLRKVGLLGTRFTMSQDFIKGRLFAQHQLQTLVPEADVQQEMQERIYNELVVGAFNASTRAFCLDRIEALAEQGAEAVILGCTELPLLLQGASSPIPLVDSLQCHCDAIARYIMQED
ncbi:amino acid racemase [Candidatus Thiothrix sp. Deng01]|uniref:Amino acid racemase n=1 Tax=Candidatus Thiothrix phosphatis TaxID=3112415 RepID=A0ABU6D1N0_9GAMM|nr:amino acid racemase [Candidatus Thiothrix sp. Deng01]MEB4592761.1 amino acid racemase [Candidatus Thiothrix sp. Deng01]